MTGGHLLECNHSARVDSARRLPNQIAHQAVQHSLQGFVGEQVFGSGRELALRSTQGFIEDPHMRAEHLWPEHPCLHPVIHVGGEIGDLIGQIDQLRLQGRLLVKKVRNEAPGARRRSNCGSA